MSRHFSKLDSRARLVFVAPDLDGPSTGGTLYNQQLLSALAGQPVSWRQCNLQALGAVAPDEQVWVDSLYLAAMNELRAALPAQTRLGLLLHYLPSLLHRPDDACAAQLSLLERGALEQADMIVTPSEFLRSVVMDVSPFKRCTCVTPGVRVAKLGGAPVRDGSAIMVCNVTSNKGVLPFLRELGARVSCWDTFRLEIAGSLTLDPAYVQQCQKVQRLHPWLSAHVQWLGSVSQPALFERLSRASVCVSASVMESYGMALAEARAHGTPIVAVQGGNVAAHIAADSGGELVRDARALAFALVELLRDPTALATRQARARSAACARDWELAARDFMRAVDAPLSG